MLQDLEVALLTYQIMNFKEHPNVNDSPKQF